MIEFEVNGRTLSCDASTVFKVEVSRGAGSYRTRYEIVGRPGQALLLYKGINIGSPYRKRLKMGDLVIVRSKGI